MHFVNGQQFLNTTLTLASPPVAVIFPATRVYTSEYSQSFDLMTLVSILMVVLSSCPSP